MILLIAGLFLWTLAHSFKRLMPARREAIGTPGKAVVAVVILAGLVLMVLGYRGADFIPVWTPPAFMVHINNLLMVLAFWVYGSGAAKGPKAWPGYKFRHPMLTGVKIWAVGHLLVNGDLASILLFGGLLGWAVLEVILINRAEPEWAPGEPGGRQVYIKHAIISSVIFVVVVTMHIWLGVWPFPS